LTMRVGSGQHFRCASWLERSVERWRRGGARPAPPILRRLHEIVLDLLPGEHLVSTLPGGERVRLSARCRQLSWNPEEYAAFRKVVRAGSTVLDVGANVGAYTLLFAQWAGPAGRVIAFEPAPASIAGLRRQLHLNGLTGRVEVVAAAVGDAVGSASFECDGASGANALATSPRGAHTITVATTTIDAFCAERGVRPDVIKIDVEGSELDVLRGARRTLQATSIEVFIEFHPSAWVSRGIAPASMRAELAAQGFVAEPLDPSIDIWNTEGISVRLRRA
jgi:FkbM family methyltransferase